VIPEASALNPSGTMESAVRQADESGQMAVGGTFLQNALTRGS
jgi:hypothetical protein